jgi:hypothetical protein
MNENCFQTKLSNQPSKKVLPDKFIIIHRCTGIFLQDIFVSLKKNNLAQYINILLYYSSMFNLFFPQTSFDTFKNYTRYYIISFTIGLHLLVRRKNIRKTVIRLIMKLAPMIRSWLCLNRNIMMKRIE